MNGRAIGIALAAAASASMAFAAAPAPLNRYGFADLPVPRPIEATLALFAFAAAVATIGLWLGHWRGSRGKAGERSLAALAVLPLYVCAWLSLQPDFVTAPLSWFIGIGYGLAAMGFVAGLALEAGRPRAAWLVHGGAIAAAMLYVLHEWMPPLALALGFAGLALGSRGTVRALFSGLAVPPLLLMAAGETGTWLAY